VKPGQYLIVALGLAAVLTGGVAVFDSRVDPFGLAAARSAVESPGGGDSERPGAFWRKAFSVRGTMPRTVILGTSRAEAGIDPAYRGLASEYGPVLNLSLGAMSIEQMRLMLVHAKATSPVRMAVVGLDMESFLDGGRPDFDPAALEGNPESEPQSLVRLRIDVSREALSSSLATWMERSADRKVAADRGVAGDLPPRRASADLLRLFDGQRGVIWAAEFANFYGRISYLFPSWPPGTRWSSDRRRAASMKSFREMLAFARRNEIDLRLFISPVHARYLDWYERAGWWPMFEAWKRALVSAIDEESNSASDQPRFVLWDFSGFHDLAQEPVPRIGDHSTLMRWYRDTSHYSPETGGLILDQVLGGGVAAVPLPGVRLERATIDSHLEHIRAEAEAYRRRQPGEAANVAEMLAYLRRVAKR